MTATPLTAEAVLAAMQEIIDGNGVDPNDPNSSNSAPLSEEDLARYEDLERQLQLIRRGEEVVKRQAAYRSVTAPVRAA